MRVPAGFPGLSVRALTLTDFRNHPRLSLTLGPRPVVLTGANGAGKTNLLEALSLLGPGQGLRRARLTDMGHSDRGHSDRGHSDRGHSIADAAPRPWAVTAELDTPTGRVRLATGLKPDGGDRSRRLARVNGEPVAGPGTLARHLRLVWLTPAMDRLFQEAPSGRRRFLDRLVLGLDPDHAQRLSAYDRALRERAALLRTDRPDPGWLTALEGRMAGWGVAVAAARRQTVRRLAAALAPDDPFPVPGLALAGMAEEALAHGPALAAEEALARALRDSRRRDGESGGTAVGPHRSDLRVWHRADGRPAAEGSTGEQKALLVALLLAQARVLAAEGEAPPLMLLDEVAAHLDPDRRAALFQAVLGLGVQAWLTGTEPALFAPLAGQAQRGQVVPGQVIWDGDEGDASGGQEGASGRGASRE